MIAATIVALGAIQIGFSTGTAILAGAAVAAIGFIVWSYLVREHAMQLMRDHLPEFPTKDSAG